MEFLRIQYTNQFRRSESNYFIKNIKIIDIKDYVNDDIQNTTKVKYFKEPNLRDFPLNLKIGYENYIFRCITNTNIQLKHITDFLLSKKDAGINDDHNERCKIYTERGVLFRTMLWPYYSRLHARYFLESFLATKIKDDLYLAPGRNQQMEKEVINPTPNDTYSFKFRQICFSDSPNTNPNTDTPINEGQQTCCIYRADFAEFELIYSAELNGGIISEKELEDVKNLEELNKCRFIMTKLLHEKFSCTQYKNLDYYLQGYLANVNDIYLGFKNRNGCVNAPGLRLSVAKLPQHQIWRSQICMNFLHKLFKKIQKEMADIDCPYTVYEFKFNPEKNIINCKRHIGKNDLSFLSNEFIEKMKN